MKSNMKNKYIYLIIYTIIALGLSCTDDFEKINKNPLYPDKEMEQLDGILNSAYLPSLQKNVIAVGTASDATVFVNKYQVAYNLAGDSWAGYLSPRDNKFNGGQSFTTFFFIEGWVNNVFSWMTTDVFAPWIQLKNINMTGDNPNKEMYAIAQITKIMALHRTTDMFGPMPYSGVGSGSFTVEYDSQETIYKSFFEELEEASNILFSFYSEGNTQIPFTKDADIVYEGNVENWIRLANSLMLRLAIRVRYADEGLAKTYAEKAVSHSIGLIETVDQIAEMSKGAGLDMRHSLKTINDEYNDTRMGATIQSYLKGYNDPRMSKYFTNSGDKAVRAGIPQTQNAYESASRPNIEAETATYWIKASEVLFLKAEGALAGFNMGGRSAKDLYEAGIRMSFEENKVNLGNYLSSSGQPSNYIDPTNIYSAGAPSSVTVTWNESAEVESKLEKIITQKYLAIYPDGQEAWSEWRRTGYPRQIPPAVNFTNEDVVKSDGHKNGVRRMPYPRNEYDNNIENLNKAISTYLGGIDNAATNVWWDKKVKK